MFWKKEVKEKTPEVEESPHHSLDKLTAKIEKINALVDFLMESKKVDTEKFTRINEQIGELRGEIAEREKKIQNLEAEATKASELVKAVQPEKLLAKVEKENVKIEIVKAKLESQEKISNEIIKEVKDIRKLVKAFRGTEQVIKLNKELNGEIITAKKILTNVDINASKVEQLFTDFNKEFLELKTSKEDTEKMKTILIDLKKESDSNKITISELGKMRELMDTEKIKEEQERDIEELKSEMNKIREPIGEMKGILEEIRKSKRNIESDKERIEQLAKESQKRHIIFQDLFLEFQKNYQIKKDKELETEENIKNLKEYIKESLINNVKKSEIRKELSKKGWSHEVIEELV